MSTEPTVTEKTRASLPIRDYIVATGFIIVWSIGLVLYCDRRLAALESGRSAIEKDIAEIKAGRTGDNAKFDKLFETLSDVRTGVARIEERTRKP